MKYPAAMTETISAIVLNCIRHSDRTSILRVITPVHGCISLAVSASGGARGRRNSAVRMPLAPIEFNCRVRPDDTLVRPSALTLRHSYRSIYFHPVKNALSIFLAEFLYKLLRETPPDPPLYRFIDSSLQVLDEMPGTPANFHITFLCRLTHLLGIAPQTRTFTPGDIFDMRAATFTRVHPGHPDILIGSEARLPHILSRLTYTNMHRLRLTRTARRELLRGILAYYAIHLPPPLRLNSLDVLSQLFD